ncbi:MAG TPA: mechanosensitive ion channel domain-containing protein, partial [Chitinophagaceae bacterium]|nr:mechanosensitive ion channel domain-containing protein [Chitinophagaceae bacterium]
MNEFLNKLVFDNPIWKYLVVIGVILFVLILKRVISRYFAGLIYAVVKNIFKGVDKRSFSDLVAKPLGMFLLILVSIVALHKLTFPGYWDFEIYKYNSKDIVHTAGTLVLIISFVWLLWRMIDFIALILERKADLTPSPTDNQLIIFFKDFFKVVLGVIGMLMILKAFGFNISSLITGLSIATAAIALALRESLENLIASFIIFFDKPFSVGDLVHVQQVTGTVERIGLRSTRIRTDQKTYVSVPNKQMVDSILDNLSLRTQRKAEIRLEIDVSISSEALNKFIEAAKTKLVHPHIEDSSVFLTEIRSNSFLINVDFFTAPISVQEFNKLKQQKSLEILKTMEEMKIEMAGANRAIKISGKLEQ